MIVLADVVLLVIENVVQLLLIVLLFIELVSFMDDAVMVVQFLNLEEKKILSQVKVKTSAKM